MNSTVNLGTHNTENYKGYITVESLRATDNIISTKDTTIKNKNIEVDSIEDMHLFFIKFFQQSRKILSFQENGLLNITNKNSSKCTVAILEEELDLNN